MQSSQCVVCLTAGGGGMYCGSCMRDNTLVAAMQRLGHDAILVPTYTPIRTDEDDVSINRVLLGGINVYLEEKSRLFRSLPRTWDRFLSHPRLIRWLSSRGIRTDARQLGALTVSMLQGEAGRQSKEVSRLVDWLGSDAQPKLINLTNLLIAGCVPTIKRRLNVPVLVTLQGDDLFLEELMEPFRSQAIGEIQRLAEYIDGFLVFSRYYADFMSRSYGLPREQMHLVPMGINLLDYPRDIAPRPQRPPTVGYLARICPAKGWHVLVEAFTLLRKMPGTHEVRLHAAGWLGDGDRPYYRQQFDTLTKLGLGAAFHYAGVVDRAAKLQFLQGVDVLSVPTIYHEPKGLFVLEALASGVPVVQPEHGAFPELLGETSGGRLVRPHDPHHLAETLHELLLDDRLRQELATAGHRAVHTNFHDRRMAEATWQVYQRFF